MAQEPDYVSVNRAAYDTLANEYRRRADADRIKDIPLVAPFVSYLKQRFPDNIRVLDIGPGNGVNLRMLVEAGFSVVGIDISSEMLKVAGDICTAAELVLGDFLTVPFGDASFQGIFAKASLHCLPKADALLAFRKVHRLLVTDGLFYVSTTADTDSTEGLHAKDDYPGRLVRFRKRWTPTELTDAVIKSGFVIHDAGYDYETDWNKRWYNIWATRKSESLSRESRDGELST